MYINKLTVQMAFQNSLNMDFWISKSFPVNLVFATLKKFHWKFPLKTKDPNFALTTRFYINL